MTGGTKICNISIAMKAARKAYNDGLALGREESAEMIEKLKDQLTKALTAATADRPYTQSSQAASARPQ